MSRARQAATLTAQGSSQPQGGQQPPPPPQNPLVDVDMDSGTSAGGAPQGPSSNVQGMGSSFQLMQLRQKDIICEHLDSAMLNKKGIILQYLNSNSTGSTTMIGVTRVGLTDARKMPAYVTKYTSVIRQHAVTALQRHMQLTQCSTGALETLCPEDYSISFSWASVTEAGRALTHHGKPDLALGYAVCDEFVAPVVASRNDPHPVCVLNVFIQLQEAVRRRTAVLKKAKEDEAQKASTPPAKKFAHPYRKQNQANSDNLAKVVDMVAELKTELKRPAPVSFNSQDFPVLEGGQAPEWNKTGTTELPDENDM